MIMRFSDIFKDLVNNDVTRTSMISKDKDVGVPFNDFDEIYKLPEDGFIARYCLDLKR